MCVTDLLLIYISIYSLNEKKWLRKEIVEIGKSQRMCFHRNSKIYFKKTCILDRVGVRYF